jgi:hypothetical protein
MNLVMNFDRVHDDGYDWRDVLERVWREEQ